MSGPNILLMSMEEELQRTEKVTDKGSQARERVHNILGDAVSKIAFSDEDIRDPKATSSMLSILSAFTSNVKDEESTSFKRVAAKARLTEIKSSEQQAEATIGLITSITQRDTQADVKLDTDPSKIDLDVSPDIKSTINTSELRDNPDDLSDTQQSQ